MCKQKILGLDLGSNSIGWALLSGEIDLYAEYTA